MVKMADSFSQAGLIAAGEARDTIIQDVTGKYALACATIAERDAEIAALKADYKAMADKINSAEKAAAKAAAAEAEAAERAIPDTADAAPKANGAAKPPKVLDLKATPPADGPMK